MKKLIGLVLIVCACFLTAPTSMGTALLSNSADEVDLSGDLSTGRQRSLIKPIEAFITGESIEVDFNAALGIIVISIYDEEGNAVYQQSVSTCSGMHTVIDISSLEAGEYTVEFTNSQGQYLSGEFEI